MIVSPCPVATELLSAQIAGSLSKDNPRDINNILITGAPATARIRLMTYIEPTETSYFDKLRNFVSGMFGNQLITLTDYASVIK